MAALPPETRADMAAKARAYGQQQFDRASLISQLEAMLAEAGDEHHGGVCSIAPPPVLVLSPYFLPAQQAAAAQYAPCRRSPPR